MSGPTGPNGPTPTETPRPASSVPVNGIVGGLVVNVSTITVWIVWNLINRIVTDVPDDVHQSINFLLLFVVGAAVQAGYAALANKQWANLQQQSKP